MSPLDPVAAVLRSAKTVLLDFDGPVCSIFAGLPAPEVAADLADLLAAHGTSVSVELTVGGDPLDVLRHAGTAGPEVATLADTALREAELRAVDSAEPTPGAADFFVACQATGRAVAIVSNNSEPAVAGYLDRIGARHLVAHIAGRVLGRPDLMKPSPELLHQALRALHAEPAASVLVGDSTTDVDAAQAADVRTIGYANKPGKAARMHAAGVAVVVDSMTDLATLTARTPAP